MYFRPSQSCYSIALVWALAFLLGLGEFGAQGQASRFVVDDQEFLDRVAAQAGVLLRAGQLVSVQTLQCQLNREYARIQLPPVAQKPFTPPDLYDRLRESTFAVGDFYQCSACTNWHFDAATAFVISSNGVLSTCYHIIGSGADEPSGQPDYIVAADQEGNVYPVREVLAADPDADTCLLQIDAAGLRPLPVRPGVRPGEAIYCLSHPEGSLFMFTAGIVARVMRSHEVMSVDEPDGAARDPGRAALYLNITAEFSPGSSGGPVTDGFGNVIGQVQSISSGVESDARAGTNGAFVSGPVRYCVAAEEILRLTESPSGYVVPAPLAAPPGLQLNPALSASEGLEQLRSLFFRASDALEKRDAPLIGTRLLRRFDAQAKGFEARYPAGTNHWEILVLEVRAHQLRQAHQMTPQLQTPMVVLAEVLAARDATVEQKTEASHLNVMLSSSKLGDGLKFSEWEKLLNRHVLEYGRDPEMSELELEHLRLAEEFAPGRVNALAAKLANSTNSEVANAATAKLGTRSRRHNPKP